MCWKGPELEASGQGSWVSWVGGSGCEGLGPRDHIGPSRAAICHSDVPEALALVRSLDSPHPNLSSAQVEKNSKTQAPAFLPWEVCVYELVSPVVL